MTDDGQSFGTRSDSQVSASDQAEWPDWRISVATVAQLARYVNPASVASWMPTDLLSPLPSGPTSDRRRDRAAELYESLAARRIPYAAVQWNPAAYDPQGRPAFQRIRTPEETIQGPATCLDLAVLFSAMAIEAGLRPLIAVRYRPTWHALVVLDLTGAALDLREGQAAEGRPVAGREVPGFEPRPGEAGVWDQAAGEDRPLVRLAQDPVLLPVSVVEAARNFGTKFAAASGLEVASGEDSAGSGWVLVDVRQVQVTLGASPYDPPRGRSVPPIHGYLPIATSFREFGSRSGALSRLQRLIDAGEPATIVIQAPSGYGKSMLAHRLATGADHGCGWFLNSTNVAELTRSLAQAERGEHELGGERPRPGGEKADADDDQAFAAAALDRLRTAERPWVVVVDNCDSPPDVPGLVDRIPKPHAPGQVVIVTTTDPGWLAYGTGADYQEELAGIGVGDLRDLGLPAGLSYGVDGRPLVALALTALRDRGGVELPESSGLDGPELAWELLRQSPGATSEAVELARLLAWLPPEPMPRQALVKLVAWDGSPGDTLADLGFVTRSASAVPGLSADATVPVGPGLLMHRLFAAAVREQTWRDAPDAAADSIARLLTTDEGRWLFIVAADVTALARLEAYEEPKPGAPGDVELAVRRLTLRRRPGTPAPGLLWYGLGHVRERRGPVRASEVPFREAAKLLDPASYPYEVAESQIGLARVVFQSTSAELASARDAARAAQRLLAPLEAPDARQLSEQANALAWLIERRLAGREPDPAIREVRLTEVRDNLWLSYAERLRISRGLPADTPIGLDVVPKLDDGLGPERAFFNLAGTDIQLARLRHELAKLRAQAAGRQLIAGDDLLEPAKESFRAAGRVYSVVRELREQRYGGRAHPHLAACLHGLAIVAYYRAALLDEVGELAGAAANAAAGLDQRLQIAGSLSSAEAAAALLDGDVRKSVDLQLKIMAGAVLSRFSELTSGSDAVATLIREAIKEWTGGPGRMPAEVRVPERATLGFEHQVQVALPAADDYAGRVVFTPGFIQEALDSLAPLSRAAAGFQVLRVRPSASGRTSARSLDVELASSVPVSEDMGRALRWTIANAVQAPDPSWSAGSAPDTEPTPAERVVTPGTPSGFVTEPPADFVLDPPRRPRPRYLEASYPDAVQLGANFGLEAAVVLSPRGGRKAALLRDFEVGPEGKQLLLSIYARGMTVRGDHEQPIFVPAAADSSLVRFDLAATEVGLHTIRLRAWDDGSCVGELLAEVTVGADARGGPGRTLTGQMEASAIPGEITLEVSHVTNGQGHYEFRFRDPETEPRMVSLSLRSSPDDDVDALIRRLNDLAEDPGTPDEILGGLRQEGKQLWDLMVPAAVHEQFWRCRERIGQLTILADDDAFPWELLYPRDKANEAGFLVAQGFPVTRRLHGCKRSVSLRRHPARFVLPENAPDRARAEVDALRKLLGARDPDISTMRQLQQEVINSGSFGVLHFACHGNFSRDDRGPQIHLDRPFLVRALKDARDNWQAPLVFLNACHSAGSRYRCIGKDSFANGFLDAGAGAFIGSLWEVRDGTAPVFAEQLYTRLSDPDVTLGAAVAELRKKVTEDGDPTWLAYAVYGHPQAKLA